LVFCVLRRPRRVRAGPDPGTGEGGPAGRPRAGKDRWAASFLRRGRHQAGSAADSGPRRARRDHLRAARDLLRDALPVCRARRESAEVAISLPSA
jgi:hypothetical protein